MKINNLIKSLELYNNNTKDNNIKNNKIKTTQNDNFTLSTQAKDFQTVYQTLSNVPDVRQDKVDTIKKQIDEGSYFVSSQEIANKIFSNSNLI